MYAVETGSFWYDKAHEIKAMHNMKLIAKHFNELEDADNRYPNRWLYK